MAKDSLCCAVLLMVYISSHEVKSVCPDVPETCSCNTTVVNCAGLNLQNIPDSLPDTTEEIDLSRNDISMLGENLLHLKKLKRLDLSLNNISFIHPNAFTGLNNLNHLDLHRNIIYFSPSHLLLFKDLTNLETLDISGNYLWLTQVTYPDQLFLPLSNLRTLVIDGIDKDVDLGPGFQALQSLESLTFRSKLTMLTNSTLANLNGLPLKNLFVWSGWLETIEPFALAHLPNLEVLDLSFNPRLGLRNASKAWPGLQFTRISSLVLRQASPYDTEIIRIDCSFYRGLEMTKIKTLILDGNNIVTIEALFSIYLPHLEYLSLSRNRIVMVQLLMYDLSKLMNITHVDFSHQSKRLFVSAEQLLAGIFYENERKIQVQAVALSLGNQLTIEDPCELDIPSTPLPLPNQKWYISLPPRLEHLNLAESLTVDTEQLPPTVFYNGPHIKYIDYSGNGIKHLNNFIIFANKTEFGVTIDMSKNDCNFIAENFYLAESIENFILKDNKLDAYLQSNDSVRLFNKLINLRRLDLSENLIKEINVSLFENLTTLERLDLHNNAMVELLVDFSHFTNLSELDVSLNLLSTISPVVQNQLETIARQRFESQMKPGITVNLAGNPFVCGCNEIDFLMWIMRKEDQERIIEFIEYDNYTCHYGRRWNSGDFNHLLNKLNFDCNRNIIIILSTVLPVIVAAIVALSVCAKRHIWDIKFCCIDMVIKRKEARQKDLDRTENYMYDAFVAYNEQDVMWVKNEMIPNIEHSRYVQLKLCIHHRNFLPGPSIEENIVDNIKRSRKTILVVSKKFLESNWCHFEMQMARAESFDTGRDVVIAILLDHITPTTQGLSATLTNILCKRTYMVWPNEVCKQGEFWQKVREAICSQTQKSSRCQCGRVMFHRGMMYFPNGATNRLPRTDLTMDKNGDEDVLYM